MTHKELEDFLLELDGAWLDYPFGEGVAVYKYSGDQDNRSEAKMFALIEGNSQPLKVSLKCDPQLALLLREKYESVLPGYHLNKRHWNTIICSGQLDDEEVKDLARLSYQLVSGG